MNAENRRADSFHVTISNELLSLRIIIVSRTRARTVGRKFGITNALCKNSIVWKSSRVEELVLLLSDVDNNFFCQICRLSEIIN